jgi:hypothetical protein
MNKTKETPTMPEKVLLAIIKELELSAVDRVCMEDETLKEKVLQAYNVL